MPRPASGTIESHPWSDGETVSWRLRVRSNGDRHRVNLGTNHEGWNEDRAKVELERILGQVKRGTWEPPSDVTRDTDRSGETIQLTASRWWERKQLESLEPTTLADLRWRLDFILEFLGRDKTSSMCAERVDEFKDWLARKKSKRNPGETLSPRSVNSVLESLASVLDDAVEYRLLDANPARGRRRRMRVPKRRRLFLEPDMVVDLLDVAGAWEDEIRRRGHPEQCYGRRAFLAMLCLSGARISEATDLPIGLLDIHSEIARVGKAKTEAGERDINLPAFLLDELRPHLAALPGRLGSDPCPDTPLFPSRNGNPLNASNVRSRLLAGVVARANEKRAGEGRMQLPEKVTPHTLRRTFASLCFFAGRDPRFVMAQLGHSDPRMTLAVYAQTMQRQKIDHDLVWQLMRFSDETDGRSFSPANGPLHAAGAVRAA